MKLLGHLDLLAAPAKPFVMCSGEDAARSAHALIANTHVATAIPPDPGAWKHCDITEIMGRPGLMVPANTPDARADMHGMAARLLEVGCKLRWTDTSGEAPDWDVTSWTDTPEAFVTWARARTKPYEPPAAEPQPEMPPAEFPPEATAERPRKRKPVLSVVDGNTVLAADPDAASTPEPLSEDAFAHDFADRYADEWRAVDAWGKWFYWNGDGWAEDREHRRITPMRELVREALAAIGPKDLTPDGRRKISRLSVLGNSVRLAGMDEKIRTQPEEWDADPWLLGVPGGAIDLKTGNVVTASREQAISMRTSVAPRPGKPALWLKMLDYWTGGDQDLVGFLRRYFGYALTGDNREQCMVFFYGQAQAGKGTILRTLAGIMGSCTQAFRSYHYEAPISTFMESKNERHSTELAALFGKRLVTAEEPSAGARWDEGRIKWITGGSQVTARFIGRDNFSFAMTGKIIVAANHRPRLSTSDKAIRRRLHVVPFEHPVADEDRDNNLDAKLREEWPQILAWMWDGCLEWQQCGLGLPERISDSTDTYLESEDTIGTWLEECCEREGDTPGADLYDCYRKWAENQGEHTISRRAWANALLERGFQQRKSNGTRLFIGLTKKLGANLP